MIGQESDLTHRNLREHSDETKSRSHKKLCFEDVQRDPQSGAAAVVSGGEVLDCARTAALGRQHCEAVSARRPGNHRGRRLSAPGYARD